MFSSHKQILKRQGKYGTPRKDYLQSLVTLYINNEKNIQIRKKILAHLANFAYDPINYDNLLRLNVIDLFLDALDDSDEDIQEFGIGGICNCIPDNRFQEHIVANNGLEYIHLLFRTVTRKATILSTITTMYYMLSTENKEKNKIICLPSIMIHMKQLVDSKDEQIKNTVMLFLDKVA